MNENAASNIPTDPAPDPAASPAFPATPVTPVPIFLTTGAPLKTGLTPGWKTTEFWMTTLSQAAMVLGAVSGGMPTKYAALFGTVAQVAYNVSRGLAKSNAVH